MNNKKTQCYATTVAGKRCKHKCFKSTIYCFQHQIYVQILDKCLKLKLIDYKNISQNSFYHFGDQIDSIMRYSPQKYISDASQKPTGIWFAYGDTWFKHLIDQLDFNGSPNNFYIYKLKPTFCNIYDRPDINKVLSIDTLYELHEFNRIYRYNSLKINWYLVSKYYGGIYVSCRKGNSHEESMWFYLLDIDSGCVWNPNALVCI